MEETPHSERAGGAWVAGLEDRSRSNCDSVSAQTAPEPAAPRPAEGPPVKGAPTSGCALQAPARLRTQVRKGQALHGT